MPFYFFIWNDENIEHLAEHDTSPEEFEEVVTRPDFVSTSRSTGRPVAFGATAAGRYLVCIYEFIDEATVLPVTAYEPEE